MFFFPDNFDPNYWLSSGNFFQGGGESIVMQISIVMLLFSDQISGWGKSFQGNCLRGAPPAPPPVEESQIISIIFF